MLKHSYRNLYLSVISCIPTAKRKKNYTTLLKKKENYIFQVKRKNSPCKILTWHIRSIPRYYWNSCRCYWPLEYSAVIRKQVIIWNSHGSMKEPILKVFLLNEWEQLKREIGQNCVLLDCDWNYTLYFAVNTIYDILQHVFKFCKY